MKNISCTLCLILLLAPLAAAAVAEEGGSSIAILLDVSKSIAPADFADSRHLVRDFVQAAGPADNVVVYAFGDKLRRVVNPGELDRVQRSASNTALFDAMYDVARGLAEQKAARKAIVIVSDGLDTKSATVLEDTATFASSSHITIYGVGTGRGDSRSLERIAKLTGGQYYQLKTKDLAKQIVSTVASQKPVAAAVSAPVAAAAATPAEATAPAAKPEPPAPAKESEPAAEAPKEDQSGFIYWVLGILGAILVLGAITYFARRSIRKEPRVCPSCGRELQDYQTICPNCTAAVPQKDDHPPEDTTQEIKAITESDVEEEAVAVELLEKKPMGEEVLTKTFVLVETPMLIIRKGKNTGQAYALNKAYPVSIGRSRVNEIRLDDTSISGQHCRIIPENGRHVLYDLGSTNGTFLNEKKVSKAVLNEGDVIKIGETQFLYKVEQQRG